jgi:hypothetical protein
LKDALPWLVGGFVLVVVLGVAALLATGGLNPGAGYGPG